MFSLDLWYVCVRDVCGVLFVSVDCVRDVCGVCSLAVFCVFVMCFLFCVCFFV